MRTIKYTESTHQWQGTAIVREEGQLKEDDLGIMTSDKKLKEVGAKELFTKLPDGTITVEVKKLTDISITYEADSEEFKKISKVVETAEEQPKAEGEK
jgi:major membrane immunogen (membrane-anchored lipoprotein)